MPQKTSLPSVSIFEAEIMLQEQMNILKQAEKLDPIKSKLVGEFWEEHWTRAPFEECLTFKQLSSIQFDMLIKKKSFDCNKMVALSTAIKKATSATMSPRPLSTPKPTLVHQELPVVKGLSSTAAALYAGLRQYAFAIPEEHSLGMAAHKLFEACDPSELLIGWCSECLSAEASVELTGFKKNQIASVQKKIRKQIGGIFQYAAPECYMHWSTALTGAGASTYYLLSPYLYAKGIPQEFLKDLCNIFLRSIGAQSIVIKGKILPEHYAFSPKTAPQILSALKFPKKAGKATMKSILSLPFPYFDIDILSAAARKA